MADSMIGGAWGRSRPDIQESWQRCFRFGATFGQSDLPRRRVDPASPLARAARLPLRALAEQLDELPAGIVVADRTGVIVDAAHCSPAGRSALERIEMTPGTLFSEDVAGTNGIGTALAAKKPVLVASGDHLRPAFESFACVGMPLWHPRTSQLIGVVQLSTTLTDLARGDSLIRYALGHARRSIERYVAQDRATAATLLGQLFAERDASSVAPLYGMTAGTEMENAVFGLAFDARDREAIRAIGSAALAGNRAGTEPVELPSGARARFSFTSIVGDEVDDRGVLVQLQPLPPAEGADGQQRSRGGRGRVDRSRLGRTHRQEAQLALIESRSALWNRARDDIMAAFERREPVLVAGDTATGKTSLVAETFALLARKEVVVLDPEDMTRRVSARGGLNGVYDDDVGLVVLRNLALLPDDAMPRIVRMLTDRPDNILVAATLNPRRISADSPASTILPLFHHTVSVPGLADRRDDIDGIVQKFLAVLGPERHLRVDDEAMAALRRATWPGNLSQLHDVLRAATERTTGRVITLADLPPVSRWSARRLTSLEAAERDAIMGALYLHRMNKLRAARELGISRSTLYRKLAELHIDPLEPSDGAPAR